MELQTEVWTPEKGFIHCIFRRMHWHGAIVVSVEMWQSSRVGDLDNDFTTFRAGVYMQFQGEEYKIIQPRSNPYSNSFWQHLERQLSNTILLNE